MFVENTIGNSPKFPRAMFIGSDGFFCSISTCLPAFGTITSLLVQTKNIYELWQLQKHLKTMQMSEAKPNT